jgi:uncharacterized Fe-S cluster protein YjdI
MGRKAFHGKDVIVSFDPEVCQHSGNCIRGLSAVFDSKRSPWINPDGASAEAVVAQVGKCPSGALKIECSQE